MNTVTFVPHTDAVQGFFEERSKMYSRYIARVQKKITQQCAVSIISIGGFASKQVNAMRRKR